MTAAERVAVRIAVAAVAAGVLLAAPRPAGPVGGGVTCTGPDGPAVCGLADRDADVRP